MLSLFIDITAPQIEAMEYQLFMHHSTYRLFGSSKIYRYV